MQRDCLPKEVLGECLANGKAGGAFAGQLREEKDSSDKGGHHQAVSNQVISIFFFYMPANTTDDSHASCSSILCCFYGGENDFPLDFRFNLLVKTSIIVTPFTQYGYFPWHYCSCSPFHTKKAFLTPNGLFADLTLPEQIIQSSSHQQPSIPAFQLQAVKSPSNLCKVRPENRETAVRIKAIFTIRIVMQLYNN